ncbi:MAG: hypothetical protein AB7K67_16150 [Hyphomicrobiaceae bacterium]
MQFAPTRYTRIEGTEVMVQVNSADEARSAVKELKHKKREVAFVRRSLVRQRKALAVRQERSRKSKSVWRRMGLALKAFFWWLAALLTRSGPAQRKKNLATVERDIAVADEIMHNIDSCILQVEGRLITHG